MALLKAILIALLLLLIAAVAGWLNGESNYIAWGLVTVIVALVTYILLRR